MPETGNVFAASPDLLPILWAVWGWPYVVFAFFAGSVPFGVVVSRVFFRTDIRGAGSGNIGAANALRTLGKKAGVAVLLLDAAKGAVAVIVAFRLLLPIPVYVFGLPPEAAPSPLLASLGPAWALAPIAGLAAVIGHCFPPWLRFRGGKGVATYLGAAFALSWESGLAFTITWLAVVLPTGYSSLGSLAGAFVAGVVLIVAAPQYGYSAIYFAFWAFVLILWKHRENVARLRAGTENRTLLLKR